MKQPLRVQVPNYKVSTQNHNYDSKYSNPKYPIIRYFAEELVQGKLTGAAGPLSDQKGCGGC